MSDAERQMTGRGFAKGRSMDDIEMRRLNHEAAEDAAGLLQTAVWLHGETCRDVYYHDEKERLAKAADMLKDLVDLVWRRVRPRV